MSINRRAARTVRDVRERLRDAAAADHSSATDQREVAAEALAGQRDRLEEYLDDAARALAGAKTVHDLSWIADIGTSHHQAIADAQKHHNAATEAVELAALALRERTRQLRSAERVIDLVDRDRADREARTEQRANDDMTGSRR